MSESDRRKRISGVAIVTSAIAVAAIAAVSVVLLNRNAEQPPVTLPEFARLADAPDASLHGTVAYFSKDSGCVRAVEAAGAPAQDVLCIDDTEGLYGPALEFLADGRLAITLMEGSPGAGTVAWQKVADLGTGAVADTPAADLPASAEEALGTSAIPDNRGLRITTQDDRIEIIVYGSGAQRYVYAENGPPGYHLGFDPIWSPDGEWFVIDEGRLLIVTIAHPPTAHILADDPGWIGPASGPGFPVIAFTSDDLLTGG